MFSSKFIIGFLIFILLIYALATAKYWFWIIWWFDIPMHFFGGFWAAAVFINLGSRFKVQGSRFWVDLILTLSFVALIGVLWEFFEFIYGSFASKAGMDVLSAEAMKYKGINLYQDTIKDLFFDLLGGLAVAIISLIGISKANSVE